MKTPIYITIAVVAFVVAFCICFHAWADKEVFIHRICAHTYTSPAVLVDKTDYGWGYGCHWKPSDKPHVDERWGDVCLGFEPGDTNNEYLEISYTCDSHP